MENPPATSCSSLCRPRRNRMKKKAESSLSGQSIFPDDILIEILCRLPAKDVLRSRCVCRKWRDLTSTLDFTDLHMRLNNSFPLILIKDIDGLDVFDRCCWEPARTTPDIHKLYKPGNRAVNGLIDNGRGANSDIMTYGAVISHNGLIVTEGCTYKDCDTSEDGVIIYNPIYLRDLVHIIPPIKPDIYKYEVYGVFFHPVQKEYCTLWRTTLRLKPWKIQYKILNLESNPKWRDISNPCNQNTRLIDPPLLIDKHLYWMVQPYQHFKITDKASFNCDIMEYDIANEEFRVIPCPVPVNVLNNYYNRHVTFYYYNVSLIDNGGAVSLVQFFPSKETVKITIRTLKGHGGQLWTSSDYIISSDVYPTIKGPKVVAFRKGELVLHSDERLYVCNLELGTYRKLGEEYDYQVMFQSHVTSLVSLRNCKSKISPETFRNRKSKKCEGDEDWIYPKKKGGWGRGRKVVQALK